MEEKCQIVRYNCPEDLATIKALSEEADVQQAGFSEVFPWKDACLAGEQQYHYVARDTSGIVCGWLKAKLRTYNNQTHIYLSQISTRRIRNSLYGGVGQRLHKALLADAVTLGAKFIYLYPLSDAVSTLYLSWGYVKVRPELKYLFYILRAQPSKRLLDSLMPPSTMDIVLKARKIARTKTNTRKNKNTSKATLVELIDIATPTLISNQEKIRQLEEELMIMEGNELSLSEQRAELRTFFEGFLGR